MIEGRKPRYIFETQAKHKTSSFYCKLNPTVTTVSMSSEQFSHVEQDHSIPKGGDELPTYDDLAAQSGPNSRPVDSYVYLSLFV